MVKSKIKDTIKRKSKQLDLSGCKLSVVPKEIQQCVEKVPYGFTELDLSFNVFKSIQITQLSTDFNNLQTLNLSANPLVNLDFLKVADHPFKQLSELNLTGCKISVIGKWDFDSFPYLRKINLSNNNISSLSELAFSKLSKLEELSLSGNPQIGDVPASLIQCKYLEIIDLSGCEIRYLPANFGELKNCLELNLGNNKLKELPDSFGKMTRLCLLNLQDNQLDELPLSIGNCIGLSVDTSGGGLILYGNPLNKDPDLKSRITKGPAQIMDYLEKKYNLKSPNVNSINSIPKMSSQPPPYQQHQPQQQPQNQNIPKPTYIQTAGSIAGPKPLKERSLDIIIVDLKSKISGMYQFVNNQTNGSLQEQLISIGNNLTLVQDDLEKLIITILKSTKTFNFSSPIPNAQDDHMTKMKKIINLKLEKLALTTRQLGDYIVNQMSTLPPHVFDQQISIIFDVLQKTNIKLVNSNFK
eukprot:gene6656-8235_t